MFPDIKDESVIERGSHPEHRDGLEMGTLSVCDTTQCE